MNYKKLKETEQINLKFVNDLTFKFTEIAKNNPFAVSRNISPTNNSSEKSGFLNFGLMINQE